MSEAVQICSLLMNHTVVARENTKTQKTKVNLLRADGFIFCLFFCSKNWPRIDIPSICESK
jgi:hypothetical protein